MALAAGALALVALPPPPARADRPAYPWLSAPARHGTLESRVPPPAGFVREQAAAGSWAAWLRGLPMRAAGAPVLLHTGLEKPRQDVHAAVVDIDVGRGDLQQCADAVMRLRAEWLRAAGRAGEIAFDYTGGGRVSWARVAAGGRPSADGRRWREGSRPDDGYAAFRRYLAGVFAYAGTYSLARELRPAAESQIAIGDVLVKGGFPGHAILVADLARHPATGERRMLLVQSFMPAQDIHVLRNPADGSAWFALPEAGRATVTPEWTFPPGSLRRWPER
jgi:hypothetical protein